MKLDWAQLPNDIASLKAMLLAENKRANEAETRAKDLDAEIENLKLTIAKLQHAKFGPSSERRSILLDQLELQLGELVALRAQQEAAAEIAEQQAEVPQSQRKPRRKPARRPLPANLPRERRVQPAPTSCDKCGGNNLHKLGEDVTETLERAPAHWKVVENVCEKFSCRDCDCITQPPAPSHPIARAGEPDRNCWRRSCSANMAHIWRSTDRATSTRTRASISTSPHWPTGSACARRR